jgi:hypothetical protein
MRRPQQLGWLDTQSYAIKPASRCWSVCIMFPQYTLWLLQHERILLWKKSSRNFIAVQIEVLKVGLEYILVGEYRYQWEMFYNSRPMTHKKQETQPRLKLGFSSCLTPRKAWVFGPIVDIRVPININMTNTCNGANSAYRVQKQQ